MEMPIDRAVPATWSLAASMSFAFRSGILILAMSSSCLSLMVPTWSVPDHRRSLVDAGGFFQQHRRRRGLQDELEGAIFEDGDLDRDDRAPLSLGLGVVGLAEVHDGHTVRAERRADRRRGRRPPAGIWIFTTAATFFFAIDLRASASIRVPCRHKSANDSAPDPAVPTTGRRPGGAPTRTSVSDVCTRGSRTGTARPPPRPDSSRLARSKPRVRRRRRPISSFEKVRRPSRTRLRSVSVPAARP